ncbi:PAS domain S-box-containing protein/diguanylate cyclase (GGDEF) domain-containing protein [Gracilibacillus ureilyticus]|uniref:PAS domain S-box-containing protein/diguanylate cyclase (GGDEF) domain-containing protein n=1 Tax=Gracilibacillus ureilyticus TaxID=531814 RepID=A0A1H9P474_9BACI|nr:PAS domain S-box protein [Gracilibacillus ureilyticus]SER42393.1 PAS domain S-box-containing protein/diguanylate cyclase (GGDEF) domain-containing protein [Gracilibacillus ureilyticus]
MVKEFGSSFFDILTEGLSDQVYAVRPIGEGQFVYVFFNKAACRKTELTEDVIGKTIQEALAQEHAELLTEKYNQVLATKKVVVYRDSYEKNKETFHSETTLTPLFDEKDGIYLIVAAVKDVTDQLKAEQELKQIWTELFKNKKRYESLFRDNPDAVLSCDLSGYILNCNPQVTELIGYTSVEIKGRPVSELFEEESLENFSENYEWVLHGASKFARLSLKHKEGYFIPVSVKISPIMMNHEVEGIYVIFHDLTDQIESERKLYESEERFRVIAENANDLITLLNHQGKILYASPSYKRIVGFTEEDYVNKIFLYHIHPDDRESYNEIVTTSIKDGKPFTIENRHLTESGEYIWLESKGTPVFDKNKQLKHMVVLSRDISEQKSQQEKLEYDALHDHLTGLPNRRLLRSKLNDVLHSDNHLAIFMLDIDNFKHINDTYGHDAGDAVIVEFGMRIQSSLNDKDTVARMGGDEFILLIVNRSEQEVIQLAEEIKKQMHHEWDIIAENLNVTTSIGITFVENNRESELQLMKQADVALYEAKKKGKDGFCIFHSV